MEKSYLVLKIMSFVKLNLMYFNFYIRLIIFFGSIEKTYVKTSHVNLCV